MDSVENVKKAFERMGARTKVNFSSNDQVSINIETDKKGEFFSLNVGNNFANNDDCEIIPIDIKSEQRHLLLMVKRPSSRQGFFDKEKLLCGHDEQHWFVASVSHPQVNSVKTAMDALKPREVDNAIEKKHLKTKDKNRRKNAAFTRQGEWFFIPQPDMNVNSKLIIKKEPIRRGAGKPHMVDEIYRTGGETVYVNFRNPNGLTEVEYKNLISRSPSEKNWRVMVRNAGVYARGAVKHPDHSTIYLSFWHQVVPNLERSISPGRTVNAFLD